MEQVLKTVISLCMAFIQFIMSLFTTISGYLGNPTDPTQGGQTAGEIVIEEDDTDITGGTGTLSWPLRSESVIKAGYPNYDDGSYHGGIDIFLKSGSSQGEPIYACDGGRVVTAYNDGAYNTGFGNYCIIDHGTGIATLYAHCNDLTVSAGQSVTKGQMIAHIGHTGNATGPHLHLEVRIKEYDGTLTRTDPLKYLSNPYDSGSGTVASGNFVITVYGNGHGVGMSQDGAIAMAKSGKKYTDILSAYFPGTTLKTDSSTPSKVTKNGSKVTLVEYLCKTVAQEIGDDAPIEAMKAQAVCAYNYSHIHGYGSGQAYRSGFSYKGTTVEKAVFAVLGISSESETPKAKYLDYNGSFADTYYGDSVAGKTSSAAETWGGNDVPYLRGGVVSPETVEIKTYTFTSAEMKSYITSYANKKGKTVSLGSDPSQWIKIISHDASYSNSIGYVKQINVGGMTILGGTFKENLMANKIRSHCFTITYVK